MRDYTIDAWCEKHQCCRATFYNLKKRGEGPRTHKVGSRSRISEEADAEWVARMQSAAAEGGSVDEAA